MNTVNFNTLFFEVEDYGRWVHENRDIFMNLNDKEVLEGVETVYLYPSYPEPGGTLIGVSVTLSDIGLISVIFSWYSDSKNLCLEAC